MMSFLHEQSNRMSICLSIASSESLVGAVEEGDVTLGFHHLRQLQPLLLARVAAGRVVRAGVDEKHGSRLRRLHVPEQAGEVDGVRLGVKVSVHHRV